MNRKKKIKETLLKKAKKANAKNRNSNKPRYISKAERAKMEAEATHAQVVTAESNVSPASDS